MDRCPPGVLEGLCNWKAFATGEWGKAHHISWPLVAATTALTPRAWQLVKLYLADRLPQREVGTVVSDFNTFLAFDRWLGLPAQSGFLTGPGTFDWSGYQEACARAFLQFGLSTLASKGRLFSQLRSFYRWGVVREYPDFSPHTLTLLEARMAAGNIKGHHVRFRDPLHGPFSPEEKQAIKDALDLDEEHPQDCAVIGLHYELGLNPQATTRLKNHDLICYQVNGLLIYHLDVPRIKKRQAHRETKRRPISTSLGTLLTRLQHGEPEDPLMHWLPPTGPDQGIRCTMRRFVRQHHLLSSRTHSALVLTPRRFRYTLATHLAEEGASPFHIAEILDHTDLQNVGTYTETTSVIAEQVARAIDIPLQTVVQRFLGTIIETDVAAVTGPLVLGSATHIPQLPLDIGGIGACGRDVRQDGLCKWFPPLSCYLCPSFAALRQGPHQQMRHALEEYLEVSHEHTDRRIALQLEGILAAIRDVIAQIER